MTIADTSETRLAYVAESTENTIPSTPGWQNLRFTSESLVYGKQTVVSDEVRADRNIAGLAEVGFGVSGEIGFELSYGTLDDLLESLLQSSWSSNVLKNGLTPASFAFERTLELGGTDSYFRYTGCQVGSMSLNIRSREIITGRLGIMGMGHSTASAIVTGATYTAGNDNEFMTASVDVGSLSMSGVSPTPKLMSVSLNIENNLREQTAIANQGPIGIGSGRFVVTGSIEAYFESIDLYTAFVDHTSVGLQFTVGSVTTEKYTINIPVAKLSNGQVTTPGNDQDVMATFDFQGVFDGTDSTISITRAVS